MGYGLIGMEERVGAMSGRLIFSNRSGGGFTVRATLPYSDLQDELSLPELPEATR
jgi:glucose-6-phosphate-specific signal transduction histidine kinase